MFGKRRASEALDQLAGLVVVRHEKRGDVITLQCDKMVAPGQWAINASGQYALRQLAPGLRDQDGHALIIQGYTDSIGTSDLNDALSLRRAEAVRDFLTEQGVSADSMRAEGLGARRPVAGNSSVEGRGQNRRIEIVITP
jgi:outer membrane protein OmpA-like peptidoglycan-associated protein